MHCLLFWWKVALAYLQNGIIRARNEFEKQDSPTLETGEHLWRFVAVCGGLWRFVVGCGSLWRFVVVCGGLWWFVVWWFVVVCGGLWSGDLWWFVVVCGGLWWLVVCDHT